MHIAILLTYNLECLQKSWHSQVYEFLKADVKIGHENGCKFHLFRCAANNAREVALSGNFLTLKTMPEHRTWRHMLSSASVLMPSMLLLTSQNLGLVMGPSLLPLLIKVSSQLGYHTVHSQTKKLGDSLISPSYFLLPLITLFSAHIVRWCAESNRPLTMIKDRQFIMLMKVGCPCSTLPSPRTISRDLNNAFDNCHKHMDKLLHVFDRTLNIFCH